MSKWQPIETAPLNGDIVLITDGATVYAGCWTPHEKYGWHFFDSPFALGELDRDEKTRMLTEGNAWLKDDGPTHWMPLPSPPKEEGR